MLSSSRSSWKEVSRVISESSSPYSSSTVRRMAEMSASAVAASGAEACPLSDWPTGRSSSVVIFVLLIVDCRPGHDVLLVGPRGRPGGGQRTVPHAVLLARGADGQPVAVDRGDLEPLRLAAQSGAARLRDGLLGGPETGEPEPFGGSPRAMDERREQLAFGGGEGHGEGALGAVGDFLDVDAAGSLGPGHR